jgi:hypothetical protein
MLKVNKIQKDQYIGLLLLEFNITCCYVMASRFVSNGQRCILELCKQEEFEDTKGAIIIRLSKKNRQHNGSNMQQINIIGKSLLYPVHFTRV